MPFDSHVNFGYSTVAAAPVPPGAGGSLTVAAGESADFPAAPFNAVVWPAGQLPRRSSAEVVRVTAVVGDTFTITRTQEGSSARTILVGDAIADAITVKSLTDIELKFPIVDADVAAAAAIAASKLAAYPADATRVLAGDGTWPLERPAKLFDSTLGADTASIDTGAGGIAAGYDVLEIYALTRTDDAAANAAILLTVNNDAGANYDIESTTGTAAATASLGQVAQTAWAAFTHGSGGRAAVPGVLRLTIPSYAATTFEKVAEATVSAPDSTAGNEKVETRALLWRNTAAISRFKVAAQGAAKLKAGSRLLVYGM